MVNKHTNSFKLIRENSHHRDVEGPHAGELCDLTGDVGPPADGQRVADAFSVRGILHVLQTLRPGGGTHQPQEDQDGCEQEVLEYRTDSQKLKVR